MSTKGLRKNLGTVVECSENVEDCASLLTDEKKNLENIEKKKSNGVKDEPSGAQIVVGLQADNTTLSALAKDSPSASNKPVVETNDHFNEPNPSHIQKGVSAKRKGPFANSRLNIITFLNNLAAPKGDARNSTNEQSANRIEQLLAEAADSTSNAISSTKKRDSSVSNTVVDHAFGKEFIDECSSLSVKLTTSQPSLSIGDLDSMNGDKPTATDKAGSSSGGGKKSRDCPLCFSRLPNNNFPRLINCSHRSCRNCLVKYLQIEIMESRVMITCPECNELLHPADIYALLCKNPQLIEKYESFSIRRVLLSDPDTRWCPAPDCTYAVIATSCAACPQLKCERPGCGTLFCYHCKGVWHANQTCDEARRQRGVLYRETHLPTSISSNGSLGQIQFNASGVDRDNLLKPGDIKACPRCRTLIVKMNDGSCNHMVCAVCSIEFCWLCLKEISDLHYLSPTGCTFWGKKPWTRKKKLLWQIGTLIGAPVGIALIAGLAVPGIIFGVPVFVGRKAYQRFAHAGKGKRRFITAMSVLGSLIVSPVLAVMAVGVGVPIMLAYVYGVVPLSLCRNGSCGGADNKEPGYGDGEIDDEIANLTSAYMAENEKSRLLRQSGGGQDADRQLDGTSVITGMSVNSGLSSTTPNIFMVNSKGGSRLQVQAELNKRRHSVESGITSLGEKCNYEEASTKAMAGSQYYNDDKSIHTVGSGGGQYEGVSYCEEIASTKALAGSVLDTKSLTDSACGRLANCSMVNASSSAYSTHRDMSPTSMEDQPCSSGVQSFQHQDRKIALKSNSIPSEESNLEGRKSRFTSRTKSKSPSSSQIHFSNIIMTNSPEEFNEVVSKSAIPCHTSSRLSGLHARTSTSSEPVEQNDDPYKVRTFMDNLKQILNDDVAENETQNTKPRPKLAKSKGRNVRAQIIRTGSSKSYPMSMKKSENRSAEEGDDLCETTSAVNQALLGASSSASGRPSSASSQAESICDSTSSTDSTTSNQHASRKSNFFARLFRKKRT